MWEALVHVPWMLLVPDVDPRRIDVPRGHIDLAPTIAELMCMPADPPFRGKSLVPELRGTPAAARPVVVDLPRSDIMDRRRALISGKHKLIAFGDDRSFQLYDVEKDPAETEELSAKQPELLDRMKRLYEEASRDIPIVKVTGGVALKGVDPSQRY